MVVALREVPESTSQALGSLEAQRRFQDIEVIVADGSGGASEGVLDHFPWVRRLELAPGNLPALKGAGIHAARGNIVAILDPVDAAEPDWIDEIVAGLADPSVSAVGGSVMLAGPPSAANRAAYLFEYGAFAPPVAEGPTAGDLPGNNVAYRRSLLVEGCADLLREEGFHKPLFHARIRELGGSLVIRSGMRVRHLTRHRFLDFSRRRYHYGRCFGALRLRRGPRRFRVAYRLLVPTVPVLLMVRQLVRSLGHRSNRRLLTSAAPALLVVCGFWGIGEWLGCWLGPGRSCDKLY